MDNNINEELRNLQNELIRLKGAVDHIEDAKKIAVGVLDTTGKLGEKYEEQIGEFKNIIKIYEDQRLVVERLTIQIDKIDFPERLQSLGNTITKAVHKLEEIKSSYLELGKTIKACIAEEFNDQKKFREILLENLVRSDQKVKEECCSLSVHLNELDTKVESYQKHNVTALKQIRSILSLLILILIGWIVFQYV